MPNHKKTGECCQDCSYEFRCLNSLCDCHTSTLPDTPFQKIEEIMKEFEDFWTKKVGKNVALKDKIAFQSFLSTSLRTTYLAGQKSECQKLVEMVELKFKVYTNKIEKISGKNYIFPEIIDKDSIDGYNQALQDILNQLKDEE